MFEEGNRKFWITIGCLAAYTLIHIFGSPEAAEQAKSTILWIFGGGTTGLLIERQMKKGGK